MMLSRRKFVVSAMAAGLAGGAGTLIARAGKSPAHMWRGVALGGEARVVLYGADADEAGEALGAVAAEIERLEAIFSLHRATSELSRLNRTGSLNAPSRDLVEVLRAALSWRERTGGAFDPTVQPVWAAVARGLPVSRELLARTGAPVAFEPARITLPEGAAVTLNGIAQGRIADRVTDLLLARGFTDVVVNAGELRLPGTTPRPVRIPSARAAVPVAGLAIATSEPGALVFDAASFRHHLIDPRSGESPRHWRSISVFAPTAEMADALSTAFAVLPNEAVADVVASLHGVAIIGADWNGCIRHHGKRWLPPAEGAVS